MKSKLYLLALLLTICGNLFSQELLSPTIYNNAIKNYQRKLTTRSDDSINVFKTTTTLKVPFNDDFSTNSNRFPSDLSNTDYTESLISGICADRYIVKNWSYNTQQTYSYFYNTSSNEKDSIALNPVFQVLINDTPNCNTPSPPILFYPSTWDYSFDNSGNKLDSTFVSDTVLNTAYSRTYFIKDLLWLDNDAYINNHYPYMPLSLGVATLDGLNEFGRPYNLGTPEAYGLGDKLTSNSIDISSFTVEDSLYLSFWLQAEGVGDWPNLKDSFVLELKDENEEWHRVFSREGVEREQHDSLKKFIFHTQLIPAQISISDPNYYHGAFQFRFVSYATLTGNNDHWNIDFVRLDTARSAIDTGIKDINFVYPLESLLENYTLMPYRQFDATRDLKDTIIGLNRSILPSQVLNTYNYRCDDLTNNTNLFETTSGIPYNSQPLYGIFVSPKSTLNIPNTLTDSTVIKTNIYVDRSDDIVTNDSAIGFQYFYNEMAYDDGTAEMAYGIQGVGVKSVAVKYFVPEPDTLSAIKIHFSNIDVDVSSLVFNINVWKTIGIGGGTEEKIATISNQKPNYFQKLNSFHIYGFEEPIVVSDTIYIGWTQADESNLQIGFDRNSHLGIPQTYIMTNNQWSKSNITTKGSPMIRMIMDGNNYSDTSGGGASISLVNELSNSFTIYPNPASSYFKINSYLRNYQVAIFDMVGNMISELNYSNEEVIDVSELNTGIYILNISNEEGVLSSEKLFIQH